MISIGPSQSLAAATVPRSVPKPMSTASSPIGGAAGFANIELALPAHRRRGGIADMRIMRPDDRLRSFPARFKTAEQRIEHMAVAQSSRIRANCGT